ncbi:MAG TPA: hypothetical protein PKB02_04120 [Anaerohalosphaeraceae bacterium]|nr:hypothetical protein [Anaerohalosphaeraceae bacterium]
MVGVSRVSIFDFQFSIEQKQIIVEAVETLYSRLNETLSSTPMPCKACGQCCDFESFGHRLFLTPPERIYFQAGLTQNNIPLLPMTTGVCPYRKDSQCSVYPWRFAGCRIFNCTGDADLQGQLSEEAVAFCKNLCIQHGLEYQYLDLKTARNSGR